jgi:hypothetical protein
MRMSKQARRPFVPGSDFSRDGDFVAAYYTEPRRHKLVEAGREWRKVGGIAEYILTALQTHDDAMLPITDCCTPPVAARH